jgi:ribose 5-phosphate isomerase RpiB
LCWNEQTAKWSRLHNDANILAGQRTIDEAIALHIVRVWLETLFEEAVICASVNRTDEPGKVIASEAHRCSDISTGADSIMYSAA